MLTCAWSEEERQKFASVKLFRRGGGTQTRRTNKDNIGVPFLDMTNPTKERIGKYSSVQDWLNRQGMLPSVSDDGVTSPCWCCGRDTNMTVTECVQPPELLMINLPEDKKPTEWFTDEVLASTNQVDHQISYYQGSHYSLLAVIYYNGSHYNTRVGVDDQTGKRRYYEYDGLKDCGSNRDPADNRLARRAALLPDENPFPILKLPTHYVAVFLIYIKVTV